MWACIRMCAVQWACCMAHSVARRPKHTQFWWDTWLKYILIITVISHWRITKNTHTRTHTWTIHSKKTHIYFGLQAQCTLHFEWEQAKIESRKTREQERKEKKRGKHLLLLHRQLSLARATTILLHCWKLQVQLFCGFVSTNEMYETSPYRVVEFSIFHMCHVGHFNSNILVHIVTAQSPCMHAYSVDWMHWKLRRDEKNDPNVRKQ